MKKLPDLFKLPKPTWVFVCPFCAEQLLFEYRWDGSVNGGRINVSPYIPPEPVVAGVIDHYLAYRATHSLDRGMLSAEIKRQIDEELQKNADVARQFMALLPGVTGQ